MKKRAYVFVSALLVITLLLAQLNCTVVTAAQVNESATSSKSIRLNYKTKKLYVGKSFTLILNGARANKWISGNTKIATVNKNGKVKGKNKGTVIIKCKAKNGKTYKCKVTVRYNVKKECLSMKEWLISDMWNDGLCDLDWYYYQKTNACGEKMDVDYTIHKLKKNYKKINYYDRFINSLKGKKYNELKYSWSKLKPEMKRLYKLTLEIDWAKCPKKDDKFNVNLYSQYADDVEEELGKFE